MVYFSIKMDFQKGFPALRNAKFMQIKRIIVLFYSMKGVTKPRDMVSVFCLHNKMNDVAGCKNRFIYATLLAG